jgi:hypothetical protein
LEATGFFCKFISLLSSFSQLVLETKAVNSYGAQDVISCLYHILHCYGPWLAALDNPAGNAAIAGIGMSTLAALQASQESCDCLEHCNLHLMTTSLFTKPA